MKHPIRGLQGLALSLCLLGLLALPMVGCSSAAETQDVEESSSEGIDEEAGEGGGEEEGEGEDEAVPVEVVELERGRIETVLRFSTNLEAENEVRVVSQASRQLRVTELLVEEGDEVRRGQLLLRLQNDEQKIAVARVEGQLEKARREYQRQGNLYEQNLISEQVYNDATYELEQLELALEDAKRDLSYTEVRSPISGTVTERHVIAGNQVTPNQPLFDLVDFDSIVARVYVPEKELWRLEEGLQARLYADAAGSEPRFGKVDRIAPRVDPRSGTVKTTIRIPRHQELLPGMYVSVELVVAVNEDAVLVPKKALIYDADQVFVFRVREDQRVERLLVRPRLEDRYNIEPSGQLEVGDQIVVAGQAGLKNGSKVRMVGAVAAAAEPAAAPEDGAGSAADSARTSDSAATAATETDTGDEAARTNSAERKGEEGSPEAAAEDLEDLVQAWADAWSQQRVDDYLSFYASEFRPANGLSRERWAEGRRQKVAGPGYIQVEVEILETELREQDEALVRFVQAYLSDAYRDRVTKTLELVMTNDGWMIIAETVGSRMET